MEITCGDFVKLFSYITQWAFKDRDHYSGVYNETLLLGNVNIDLDLLLFIGKPRYVLIPLVGKKFRVLCKCTHNSLR